MMKIYCNVLFVLLLMFNNVFADNVELSIVDKKTEKPIEDVNICWQLLQNRKVRGFAITNSEGKVENAMPLGKKAVVVASCIGYKTLVDTIVVQQKNQFRLEKDIFNLKQVVVTGHSKPTPVDSSLYSVRVIGKQKILSSGATSLSDLFLTEPNMNLSTDFVLGTRIEMFGMSGRNVKVMIDGVPVIGRLNGQIDLSQIAIDNVDHVEIIEGPMSVIYGNNALAGTINIITNKKRYYTTEVNISTGFESVGRYSGALDMARKIGKSTVTLLGNYSKFDGVDFDKSNRSMEWKPQQEYTVGAKYKVDLGNWNIGVKASVYNNEVTIKGDVQNYKAYDSYYYTDRYTGAVNVNGKWHGNNNLSVLMSHSYYDRSSQNVTKDLTTLKEIKEPRQSSQIEKNSLLRGVWYHSFIASQLSVESGIDLNLSSMEGERIVDEEQHLNDYAAFVNIKYSPIKAIELQPGVRVAYNTVYNAPVLYSLNGKWNISDNLSWRVSVAKGYRAPTVKELYFAFVHGSVKINGNDKLKAENSENYNMSIDYDFKWNSNCLKLNAKAYYNDIRNMITLVESTKETDLYLYDNISKYKTKGGSFGATFFCKDILRVNASGIVTARYNNLSTESNTDKFTTTVDWIGGLQVKESKTKIKLNADIKLYGEKDYFYYDNDNNIKEGSRDAYQVLNASVNRAFLKNRLNITLGAKNILNVKTVKLSGPTGGGGHTSSTGTPVAYGSSYFVKASFRITK